MRGDICNINYIGKLDNNIVVEEKQNFKIQVGDLEVMIYLYFICIYLGIHLLNILNQSQLNLNLKSTSYVSASKCRRQS